MRTAVDLGEPALAGVKVEVGVLDRNDHFVNCIQGLELTCLLVLLGCDLTAGGEIATKQDQKTGQLKPLNAVYEVIIPIQNPDLYLHPGQRGFAKIDGGTHTLGWWLWRLITKTFHFTL